ncbi:hypothetical protein Xen7305DRAFT_00000910 [Xenococcus sp. PCC 7305]|uniref:DUF6816 family protein n=1 Tax=Xenococcus sp. PCC 7305 TaxID=102125 RepID=UPI0002AC983A|nr:hypothetical protein [Xenococcus sp. PCC 7305]ELS00390.1 hypothetical protein Xen7305DRAFT_00000910 [Xenococcus sp. PCC 7305]
MRKQITKTILILIIFLSGINPVYSAEYNLPSWYHQPIVEEAKGDLYYPDWMAGTWEVTNILETQVAPLAPEIVSPGFADNQKYIDEPIIFPVRFGQEYYVPQSRWFLIPLIKTENPVVADRTFNGKSIAQAYLGADSVFRVAVDPKDPNKQITLLQGGIKSISQVTKRATERPARDRFVTTEVTQQLFKSPNKIYLNEVETTSDYHLIDPQNIEATQVTAIYLSPQDPDYFTAGDRPVAIYRYHLDLSKL